MHRPSQTERRSTRPPAARPSGRTTAVGPGDRRDGEPLIFGWGRHLTRAEKQKYRNRFVLATGVFIFALIALVLGVGALQQFFFKPRAAVATVNGQTIERQWYEKNVAYSQFVLQHEGQDLQNQYQALAANQKANAAATATANPQPGGTPAPAATATPVAAGASGEPAVSANPAPGESPGAESSGTPSPAGSPTTTPTPAPTFNPQESATVAALSSKFAAGQAELRGVEQQTLENLIDAQIMRQDASKLSISVSGDEVAAQAKKITDQLGGSDELKQLFQTAKLSQGDFNQIQYNTVLRDKYQVYFAQHPDVAPTPSATPVPSPSPTVQTTGPVAPTATPLPTPVPTPGADSLVRWLEEQRNQAKITRASFPLPA